MCITACLYLLKLAHETFALFGFIPCFDFLAQISPLFPSFCQQELASLMVSMLLSCDCMTGGILSVLSKHYSIPPSSLPIMTVEHWGSPSFRPPSRPAEMVMWDSAEPLSLTRALQDVQSVQIYSAVRPFSLLCRR